MQIINSQRCGKIITALIPLIIGGTFFFAVGFGVAPTAAAPTDLFFSEYIEGSSYNKALEIYNGTGATIELSLYSVELYSNGSIKASRSIELTEN